LSFYNFFFYQGGLINLEHIDKNKSIREQSPVIKKGVSTKLYTVVMGIDMSDYYQSVEWDILTIPAQKNIKFYDCCLEEYFDIYFNITLRRKTLFYTVNLIIPCVNISFLSVLVFYLPSDSGEKLTLGISILVALLVFYLLLIDLIPPTSLVIPLLGKYLLFTLILVNLSILLTIFILNLHHRKPATHKMPRWMKVVVIEILPKILRIQRPLVALSIKKEDKMTYNKTSLYKSFLLENIGNDRKKLKKVNSTRSLNESLNDNIHYPNSIIEALNGIKYINVQMKKDSTEKKVKKKNNLDFSFNFILTFLFIKGNR
jgi:hypothetical protein